MLHAASVRSDLQRCKLRRNPSETPPTRVQALYIPDQSSLLNEQVTKHWPKLASVESRSDLDGAVKYADELKTFKDLDLDKVWAEIQRRHDDVPAEAEDLTEREYLALSDPTKAAKGDADYEARVVTALPTGWEKLLDSVVAVTRLRETKALLGFTRIDAPEYGEIDPDSVQRAPLVKSGKPSWVPAATTRGEGYLPAPQHRHPRSVGSRRRGQPPPGQPSPRPPAVAHQPRHDRPA